MTFILCGVFGDGWKLVNISTVSWGMTRLLPDSWDLKYAQSTDSLEMGWIVYWYIVEQSPKISWKLTEIPTTPCRPSYTVSIPSNSDWIVVQNVCVKDDSLCFALLCFGRTEFSVKFVTCFEKSGLVSLKATMSPNCVWCTTSYTALQHRPKRRLMKNTYGNTVCETSFAVSQPPRGISWHNFAIELYRKGFIVAWHISWVVCTLQ